MAAQAVQRKPKPDSAQKPMQKYLDKAVDVLEKFGVVSDEEVPAELIKLLEEVRHVD